MSSFAAASAPDAAALVAACVVDAIVGDPVYAAHPVRLIGRTLQRGEAWLRSRRWDGYGGGVALFLILVAIWLPSLAAMMAAAEALSPALAWLLHVGVAYTLIALGDLFRHVWRIESAVDGERLDAARVAVSALVGRDTDRMDGAACRRAAVESLTENLTDGFVSPLFWYVAFGLPGLLLFKIVSTMDSMVGYKTPRYLRFGWCGARLDDVMNYLPARLTWLLISGVAAVLPGLSGRKAWRIGLRQHAILLGPNSGWSEAAAAGAIERRVVGPIWLKGVQVTDVWVGDPNDPPLESRADVIRALALCAGVAIVAIAIAAAVLRWFASGSGPPALFR